MIDAIEGAKYLRLSARELRVICPRTTGTKCMRIEGAKCLRVEGAKCPRTDGDKCLNA
jgi:hypothetical protein